MRQFRSREKVRHRLLRSVYEENLSILGVKSASRSLRRRFLMRPLRVSLMLLGAILLGQAIQFNPISGGSGAPLQESLEVSSQAMTGDMESILASVIEVELPPVAPTDVALLPFSAKLDPSDYRSLARGGDLKIRKVFGLSVKTIMIDPGHGGETARGAIGKGGTEEKTITLDIAKKLKADLERDTEYRILMTREDDRDVPLKTRVKMANEAKADLFISIHVNALPANPIDIIETYYFGPTRDKKALELAAEVNEGSDYSYSEYTEVIKQIANQLKYQESMRLARSVQQTLYQNMKRGKADVRDFGVKRAPFVVLLGVDMPAVLVEVACLSNVEEENRLKNPSYREGIARYIETGLIKYLDEEDTKRSRA